MKICIRQDISRVTEYLRGIRSPKFERHINRIKNEHRKDNVTELDSIQTSLNNKIKATRNKIRKYNDKFKAKTENKLLIENHQKLYRMDTKHKTRSPTLC